MNNIKISLENLALNVLEIMFVCAGTLILAFLFLAQPLVVTGDSMEPEFYDKEQVVVEKISIKYKKPERGEIVIIKHPQDPRVFAIKKLVAVPGDTVKFSENSAYVNDVEIYNTGTKEVMQETLLTENQYFVMGTNQDVSIDSRKWGPIKENQIVGRVFLVYYPLKDIRLVGLR